MTSNLPTEPSDEFESALRGLTPASSQLDMAAVFYQAGFQAAAAEASLGKGRSALTFLLGAALTAAIMAPMGFRGESGSQIAEETSKQETTDNAAEQIQQPAVAVSDEHPQPEPEFEPKPVSSDPSEPSISLLDQFVGHWFVGQRSSDLPSATTLTASSAMGWDPSEIQQRWPEFRLSSDNRYQTFSLAAELPEENKPLVLSDTVQLSDNLGGGY